MEGIIYKVQAYQEHGRLLFTYTPKGKITLLAQGAQKLNQTSRILSQFLTRIEFKEGSNSKSFIKLQEGVIIDDYHLIKDDFIKTKAAAMMTEIIDHVVVDNQEHTFIYRELIEALSAKDSILSSLSFALKILKALGYEINLEPDGRTVKGVSIANGSLVYEGETIGCDLDVKAATSLLRLMHLPYQALNNDVITHIEVIKIFILKYYNYHLQTTLKNLQ